MTEITFFKKNGKFTGFSAMGHSGFKRKGHDIVCAAISVLTQNTVNSLEMIANDEVEIGVEDGYMICNIKSYESSSSQLLMSSLELGLKSIEEEYGVKYCKVVYKEENAYVKA